jgi:hypothetical protein
MKSFLPLINKQVYDFQISVISNAASIEMLSKNDKRHVKVYLSFWKRVNKMAVQFIEEQSKKLEL